MITLFHHLALRHPDGVAERHALVHDGTPLSYGALAQQIGRCAAALQRLGLRRGDRAAVFMEKRPEGIIAMFAIAAVGGVFVPVNPLLKPDQVAYILRDCGVRLFVTTPERLALMAPALAECPHLRAIFVTGTGDGLKRSDAPVVNWEEALAEPGVAPSARVIDGDMAAILYTSGSTGKPKGVVLSHRNLVAGAKSVAEYLENSADDRILCALPLSFDYGLSQVTTAFLVGGCAVLINYLLPRDVIKHTLRERITGLAAVPALWIQLAQLEWPQGIDDHLRYITNSGGSMPLTTLSLLRTKLPKTRPYLMYGLTEAFRSTYLPPEELDRRPDSIGKAIPNAEVMVVRPDGSRCSNNEPGELVHRGALVSLGYWNEPQKTAERFKPAPGQPPELPVQEMAVWSGDTVRMDKEGFLYFVGRRDEMIKSSGYRISPTEVEEVIYATDLVAEAAAVGVPHPIWGQAVVVIAVPRTDFDLDVDALQRECQRRLPPFMVPALIKVRDSGLPRNPNGKIDRKSLALDLSDAFGIPPADE